MSLARLIAQDHRTLSAAPFLGSIAAELIDRSAGVDHGDVFRIGRRGEAILEAAAQVSSLSRATPRSVSTRSSSASAARSEPSTTSSEARLRVDPPLGSFLLNLTSHCPRSRFARQPHYLGGADAPLRSIEPTRNGSLAWTGLSGAESIGLRLQQK